MMQAEDYSKILVEDIHSATITTIAGDSHPQKCIDISVKPVVIDPNRCLHCGRCAEICPKQVIENRL